MRTDRLVFLLVAFVTACGLLAPPGDYGSEYTNANENDERPRDASSEDGD